MLRYYYPGVMAYVVKYSFIFVQYELNCGIVVLKLNHIYKQGFTGEPENQEMLGA